jgi:hypothetical protein
VSPRGSGALDGSGRAEQASDATRARSALRLAARTVLKENAWTPQLLDGAKRKPSWAAAHGGKARAGARTSNRQQSDGRRRCQAVAQQVRTTLAPLARTTNQLDEASAVMQPATPGAGPQAPAPGFKAQPLAGVRGI